MKQTLGCLIYIVYLLIGLVALAAIMGGLEDWIGIPWYIVIFIALPVAFIPIVRTVLGIMGAIHSFGWSPTFAIIFFCWPLILYLIGTLVIGIEDLVKRNW
ncbi:MAG: hypothetical protein FXF47_09125 [Candidatus Mcinerneyibacterium aminivorans]|uniref:Uncharacterized protein n=1 Tax=Candidatus Mcinerneyibacterium aminivorans TaxID=2703815 RepID=A0A5D0MF10_9BACT|nr:MAG: hypothetical protein FXF47_09125 [Candidatus Mcinerneyibacterium aminivorans]